MGVKKGELPIGKLMQAAVEKAGRPMAAVELADELGITVSHACSELRRQVIWRHMHVAVLDYCGGHRPKHMFANGQAPDGHEPEVVGEPAKKPGVAPKTDVIRYASVWDYAERQR